MKDNIRTKTVWMPMKYPHSIRRNLYNKPMEHKWGDSLVCYKVMPRQRCKFRVNLPYDRYLMEHWPSNK